MKEIGGFWWPDHDRHAAQAVLATYNDADEAMRLCRKRGVAVQAGGNVGVWARHLKQDFGQVWTFEPDLENYLCLLRNETGAMTFWAALGVAPGTCGLQRETGNAGAHRVDGKGRIPVITIDELGLEGCDLIALDIEGSEPDALKGAEKTIEKFRPVLMVEDKGLSELYGVARGWSRKFPGYRVVKEINRDVILAPE